MRLRGVRFGEYHTVDDWNLILNSKTVETPKAKTTFVSIQDRDGSLDMSEALTGEVKYDARKLSFVFLLTEGDYRHRENMIHEILASIHGKRMNIILDDDMEKYFDGRVEVTSYSNSKAYGSITVEATCDPYRVSIYGTTEVFSLSSNLEKFDLENIGDKTVVPTFYVTNTATIEFDTSQVVLTKGTHVLDGFVLRRGLTSFSASGIGALTVSWKEGYL